MSNEEKVSQLLLSDFPLKSYKLSWKDSCDLSWTAKLIAAALGNRLFQS